jgi:hypothetical protein
LDKFEAALGDLVDMGDFNISLFVELGNVETTAEGVLVTEWLTATID